MIATPIRYPIGSYRVCPNRPRIARVKSCHVIPFSVVLHNSVTHWRSLPRRPAPATGPMQDKP